jgi:tRNA-intron endonuclease, archaea type
MFLNKIFLLKTMSAKKTKNTTKKKPTKKTKKQQKKETIPENVVKSQLVEERVVTEESDQARELFNQGGYGKVIENKLQLSLLEALYLVEKKKLAVVDKRKPLTYEKFLKHAKKIEPNFWIRYCVFKDFRNRGYIIKTALKFGADFRIYDRGVKPGEDHAKWIVYPVAEGATLTWHDFAAKNRVAHSTKKRLLMAIVDDESDVTYYEVAWKRP